ncbi:MAG: M3 family metallopeptidase, partial [Amnibacterium sp.]
MAANPLLTPSPLPSGLPPFADIRDEDYEPAFERGMSEHLIAVARIAENPEPPTFENTVEALEVASRLLDRVSAAFFTLTAADGRPAIRDLEARMAPRLAAHDDAIRLNAKLFARIEAVHAARHDLDPVARYLTERYRIEYVLAGAALEPASKDELRALNERLSELTTRFDANLVADTNALALHLTDQAELAGLADDEVAAAAAAATERGLEGWLLPLVLPTSQPALAGLADPGVRRRLMAASLARGSRDGEHDNRPLVLEIVRLRARRARLLGYPNHAASVLADETARTPEAVSAMLDRLVPAAAANARAEADALAARLRQETGSDAPLAASDWAWAAERERAARFDLDAATLRPYLEADRVLRDGVFAA